MDEGWDAVLAAEKAQLRLRYRRPRSWDDFPAEVALAAFERAARLYERLKVRFSRSYHLTPLEFQVLLGAWHYSEAGQDFFIGTVATLLDTYDVSVASTILTRLRKKGLIELPRDPENRRKKKVLLTSLGKKKRREAFGGYKEMSERLFFDLTGFPRDHAEPLARWLTVMRHLTEGMELLLEAVQKDSKSAASSIGELVTPADLHRLRRAGQPKGPTTGPKQSRLPDED